ncbi:hypothetical protein [Streptomyces sp. NPDC047000]|uniref:hypothetical protein n=1 Tax=Streptomyces sp. NPDC047000 TaxID=3155474 RepID=UPI0033F13B10
MAEFDEEGYRRDRADVIRRARDRGLYGDPEFKNVLDAVLLHIWQEGMSVARGEVPGPAATDAVNELVEQFKKRNAFHVKHDWWGRNQGRRDFRALRTAVARQARKNLYLWSKVEPGPAAKKAGDQPILETTVPGWMFNGKNFGNEKWSDAPTMQDMWTGFSKAYVEGAEGPVTGVVLGGLVPNSVLTSVEWPHLRPKIESGEVPFLRLHIVDIEGVSNDSRTWTLKTDRYVEIHSQNSFDNAAHVGDDPEYWSDQQRWHNRQALERSVTVSSSGNCTLEDLERAFTNPNQLVLMSNGGPGILSESPDELSRVTTELSKLDSQALRNMRQSVALSAQPGNAQPSNAEQYAAAATLDYKLSQLAAERARKGSAATAQSLSHADSQGDVRALAAAMANTTMSDASPYAGYSAGSSYAGYAAGSSSAGYAAGSSYAGYSAGSSYAGYAAGSSSADATTDGYASPVDAGNYSPPGYNQSAPRAGSDGSGESQFGYELARVPHVSNQPVRPEAPSRSGGKKRR